MIKRFLHGAIIYSLLPQIPKVVTIFTYPILTRYLTATDYGIYGVSTAYIALISIIKDLGFTLVFINNYYKHPSSFKFVWRHLHGLLYLWSFIYSVLLAGLLYWAIPAEAAGHRWSIIFFSVVPVFLFENVQSLSAILYRVMEKPLPVTLISLTGALLSIVVTLVYVVYYRAGYMSWFYAAFVSSLVMCLLHAFHLYGKQRLYPILRFRWQYFRKYLKVSGPMILHDYSGYLLNTSDRIVMDVEKVKVTDIGFYNIAYIFGGYFSFFETAMGMAASPIFLRYYSEKKEVEARRLTFLSQMIFLIVSFLTCLWLREIFFLFVKNDELKTAYSLGIIIIMGYNYKPMYQASTNILFYHEKTTAILKISFVAGALNVALNFILIPVYGFKVAAFTTLGCLLFMGFRGFYLKEYIESKTLDYHPMKWLAGILGTTAAVYLIRDIPLVYKIVVTGAIMMMTAVLYRRNKHLLFQS